MAAAGNSCLGLCYMDVVVAGNRMAGWMGSLVGPYDNPVVRRYYQYPSTWGVQQTEA